MAKHEMLFAPVSMVWRDVEELRADLMGASSPSATAASRAQIAAIELLVREGDRLHRQRRYPEAVASYKEARARILKLVLPSLSVGSYVKDRYQSLPSGTDVETALIRVGIRLTDAVRPLDGQHEPVYLPDASFEVPAAIRAHTTAGFHELQTLDELVESVNLQAVELLQERKASSAVAMMEAAHERATARGAKVDRSLVAALQLNLAAGHLMMMDAAKAADFASKAGESYAAVKDQVGSAQALHLAGASATMAGDDQQAKRLLASAAEALSQSDAPRDPPGLRRGPVSPVALRSTMVASALRPALAETAVSRATLAESTASRAAVEPVLAREPVSRDVETLEAVVGKEPSVLTVRTSGRADGWTVMRLPDASESRQLAKSWSVGVPTGASIEQLTLGEAGLPEESTVREALYASRITTTNVRDLLIRVVDPSTTSFHLNHLYGYVLPVKIGDSLHELGSYEDAETSYREAAGYGSLNRAIEGTALWIRLARNALEHADVLYKREQLDRARARYETIVTADGGVPESFLYQTAALEQPAAEAQRLIGELGSRPLLRINPGLSMLVLTASARLAQLVQGFDFYGLLLSPIHTFEYLQSVAQAMCREAIQAEREFINFKSREELEAATRRDLERAVAMAEAEVEGRRQLYEAARDDRQAAERAMELATRRRNDAIDQRNHYASTSLQQIWAQAAATAQGGGSDSWYSEISELADKLDRGESISGERGKLAAAYALHGGRKNREYELARMQDTIDQLTAAIEVAREQRDSATHRENAAEIAWRAAQEQSEMAEASLEAFDEELFTPDAWATMATVMRSVSASHLERAIRIAKLMERAYNFENDTALHVIKSEYGYGLAGDDAGSDTRLLGGDALMVDVEAFTYHAITSITRKSSRIKDVISVANEFPAQFEELRRTGLLSIETDLYEFDRLHPGFYEQRLEAVEVELIGLVSPEGLNGTLTAGGVTKFRRRDGSTASRTHVVDTMALSGFELRNDVFLYTADTGVRGQFQGIGVGSTWQLHLPRRSNDFEFDRIFDVRLILYYKAKYDAALRTSVLEQPVRPGELSLLRNLRLRYDFPAAWYAFYKDGATTFELDRERFPAHQRAFSTNAVLARVVTEEGVSNEGIELRITGPGGVGGTATTGPEGAVSTEMAGLSDLVGVDPLGEWTVELLGGPSLLEDGELRYGRVRDVQLGIDYSFEYEEEVI